jgi:O-antigen/teichoic acid export membrane protein
MCISQRAKIAADTNHTEDMSCAAAKKTSQINRLAGLLRHPFLNTMLVYTGGDVLSKVLPFVLLPIVAHYISPADFGLLTNFGVAVQILTAICALNTYTALTVYYFQVPKREIPACFSNLLYLILGLSAVSLVLLLISKGWVHRGLNLDPLWLIIALVTAATTSIINLYTALLRIENKAIEFNIVQIVQSLATGLIAIVFVVGFRWGWKGRALSMAVGPLVLTLIVLALSKKSGLVYAGVEKNKIKEFFYFGLPLFPHTLSFWLKSGVDKILISVNVGLADNGIYSIALTMASLVGIFTTAFFNAYAPRFFNYLSLLDESSDEASHQIKKKLVFVIYLFTVILAVVAALSYFALSVIIPLLFKLEYQRALTYLPVIMVAVFFDGMYSVVSGFAFYKRKTKILGTITFTSSLVQMGLTFLLVRRFGAMGAAMSSATISAMTFLAVLLYSNKLYRLPWFFSPS